MVRRAKPPVEPDRIPATSTRHHKLLGLLFLGLISTIAYLNADHEEFYFDSKGGRSIENQRVRDLGGMLHSTWKAPWVPGSQLPFATFAVNYALNEAVGLRGFDVTTFLAFPQPLPDLVGGA
ncbi:MAG: hypothetical protein ACE5EL_07330, partial [Anaerolineae bacterium]